MLICRPVFRALPVVFIVVAIGLLAPTGQAQTPAPDAPTPTLADLSKAGALIQERDYAAAEEVLTDLQPQFPDDPRLHLMLGEVLLTLGEPEDAAESLSRAIELSPDLKRANFQLASAQAATGDTQGALDSYARELAVNDDIQVASLAHMNRSLLLQRLRKWAEAAEELKAFLSLNPAEARAYGDLVTLHLRNGSPEEGAAALKEGEARQFFSGRHHFDVGAAFYKAGNTNAAVLHFEEAIELDPELADAERSLAAALDRMERRNEAAQHLRRYLELRPDAPDRAEVERRIAEDS